VKKKTPRKAPAGAKGAAAADAGKEAKAAPPKAKIAFGARLRTNARLLPGKLRAAAGRAKAFAKKAAAKMLADGLVCFTAVFAACAGAMLLIQLVPWISRQGVTDIDPLPILVFSFAIAFAAASLRYNIMKKFSGIRP
jgi:hypothetical protein